MYVVFHNFLPIKMILDSDKRVWLFLLRVWLFQDITSNWASVGAKKMEKSLSLGLGQPIYSSENLIRYLSLLIPAFLTFHNK